MLLTIIIVNYNTPDLVYDCLKAIKKYITDITYEVILVENGSAESKRLIEKEIALALGVQKSNNQKAEQKIEPTTINYKLLTTPRNLGFGGGNNAGVKLARGKYLLLLNPDTLLVDDSLTKLLTFLGAHSKIGAITPFLYQKDRKTLQESFYGPFQSLSTLIIRKKNLDTLQHGNSETFSVDRISAAALMIRRDLFNQIKGFDENFFMYMEDDDLCKRIADLGYKNAVLPTAKIIHIEGQASTSKLKKKYYYKSQSYYWRKHYGILPTLVMQIIRWPYKLVNTNFK